MLDDFTFNNNFTLIRSDVYETDENFKIEIELPGIKKEDIKLDYIEEYITVSAKREKINIDERYQRRERYYGELKRSFFIGPNKENDIKTFFQDGVLTINIKKDKN